MSEPKFAETVIAEQKYDAKNDKEISFNKGDKIIIIKHHEPGYSKGILTKNNKIGYFPLTYTKSINKEGSQDIELTTSSHNINNRNKNMGLLGDHIKINIEDNLDLKNDDIELSKDLINAENENYHTFAYETLNLKSDRNSQTKYGLVSHYMSISSSITMICLGVVAVIMVFDSSVFLINYEIIYDKKYYLYSGIYCFGIGLLMLTWEYSFGIVRSNKNCLPVRGFIYLFIGIPCFWSWHTALPGLFWFATSFFDVLAYKNGEKQVYFKKKVKKIDDSSREVCCRCLSIVIVVPDIIYWFQDLRSQSKIKKYLFALIFIILNVLYTLERWWFYYNDTITLNNAANNRVDYGDFFTKEVTAQILSQHQNGQILSHIWLPIAKMFGNLLDINCAFILLPVCRTFIRNLYNISTNQSRKARCYNFILSFIPLDKAIQWHKLMAFLILFGSIIHTFAHYMNYNQVPLSYSTIYGETVWITGVILLLCMHLMYSTSMMTVRHGKFETFWYTHHLFIIFFICLLIHGRRSWNPNFWKWFIVPGTLYIIERTLRKYRSIHPIGVISVTHMNNKHAKIFCLELEKTGPISNYKEGQYIFINAPIISKYEWHPFTISSAPHEETVTLHIRNMGKGSWTDRLQEFYLALTNNKPHKKLFARNGLNFEVAKKDIQGNNLISVDGPMAAPTQHLGEYTTAVIIGAGIGVTPLRATLKSIVYNRFKRGIGNTYPNTAYCIWIVNHKQIDAYKFMCRTLKECEDELYDMRVKNKEFMKTKTLKIHIYITSVKDDIKEDINYDELKQECGNDVKIDMQNWGPHHHNDDNHLSNEINKVDAPFCEVEIYKNLKNPPKNNDVKVLGDIIFHRGRPKWKDLFLPLRKKYRGTKIGVMFCGPNIIANDLKVNCGKFTNHNTNTVFLLHKENF